MTAATVLGIAAAWLGLLLVACAARVVGARDAASRIVALDTLVLVLIAALVAYSASLGSHHLLDVALALALVGLVATLAAARYHGDGGPFG